MKRFACRLLLASLVSVLAACSGPFGVSGFGPTGDPAGPGRGSRSGTELVGRWKLVRIVSGDGGAQVPEEPNRYVVEFLGDGNFAARADCNVARGGWSARSPNRVEIGPVSATRAMCPPNSLGPRFLRVLSRVRSFARTNDDLRLSVEDGGDALELEPLRDERPPSAGRR